jgi:phosphatidylethanolamine/phosphatidyl-N-methylethanolamine N-methyltransferase
MSSRCASTDAFVFFRAWSRKPLRVASVVPSGHSLGRLITRDLHGNCGSVIELGPGTGVFTRAIIARGVEEQNIVLVETGSEFVGMLSRRFPRATLFEADAAQLGSFDIVGPVGAVVSGLPLLSMTTNQVEAIMSGAFKHLASEGSFYQFTYGPRCPVPRKTLRLLGLEAKLVGRALLNFPPASVYRISRRPM